MRRASTFLLLMCFLKGPALLAQQDEEEPLPPPRHGGAAKIGGAIGFTTSYLFLDMDAFNQVFGNASAAQFSSKGMVLYGGQGYGYVMIVPNLRIGYLNMGGTRKSLSVEGNTRRYIDLSVGFSGASFDYVIPVVPRLDLSLGILVGGGGVDITMSRDEGFAKTWDKVWTDFGDPGTAAVEYSRKLSGRFFIYQPSINIEFALLRWLGLRAGASYLGMAGGSWQIDDRYELVGVPDNISGKGWMINGGVFVGTFLF